MLDPRLKDYMSASYAKLGEYGYKNALNMLKGKGNTRSNKELLERRVKLWLILKVLFRHVDYTTDIPTLYRITEEEVNKFVRCLLNLAEINDYPVSPNILPTVKPIIVQQGDQGIQGVAGTNGTDANIIVESIDDKQEVVVTSAIESGVRHDKINFLPYTVPIILAAIQGIKIFETGDDVVFNLNLTSTKGRDNIITIVCDDSAVNAVLQPLIDLPDLNDTGDQPVIIIIPVPTQSVNKTFIFTESDALVNSVSQDSISFFYPFLYGISNTTTGFDYYLTFTKLIEGKANKSFLLNGTDKYFWIAYPASYGDLVRIRDQNGDEITDAFTKVVDNVSSSNLDNNWVHSYNLYRTTIKTTIINKYYSIEF